MDWNKYHPFFARQEFACKCGCQRADMSPEFMEKLLALRLEYRLPMPISSGFRCPTHNARVSSTGPNGPHTTGKAADILCFGREPVDIIPIALRLGFKGYGINQKGPTGKRFLHLDTLPNASGQPRPWVWTY